jgi:hypothetical protein
MLAFVCSPDYILMSPDWWFIFRFLFSTTFLAEPFDFSFEDLTDWVNVAVAPSPIVCVGGSVATHCVPLLGVTVPYFC